MESATRNVVFDFTFCPLLILSTVTSEYSVFGGANKEDFLRNRSTHIVELKRTSYFVEALALRPTHEGLSQEWKHTQRCEIEGSKSVAALLLLFHHSK